MSPTTVRVAVVQGETTREPGASLDATERLTREAVRNGAALVAFPETWLPGYPAWLDVCRDVALWDHPAAKQVHARYAEDSVVVGGATGDALAAIARSSGATLVLGASERVDAGPGSRTLYNSLLTYGPDGTLLNHHRKLWPTFSERMVWGAGDADGLRAVDTPAGRVGGLVCWEHFMPLARQALHESGEHIHVAAWPTAHERNQIASRQMAFEGRCFVLVACSLMRARTLPPGLEPHPDRVRSPDEWVVRGGSAIIGPDGFYIVEPRFEEPCILYADLDFSRIREESQTLDVGGHYARPDLLSFSVRRPTRRVG